MAIDSDNQDADSRLAVKFYKRAVQLEHESSELADLYLKILTLYALWSLEIT